MIRIGRTFLMYEDEDVLTQSRRRVQIFLWDLGKEPLDHIFIHSHRHSGRYSPCLIWSNWNIIQDFLVLASSDFPTNQQSLFLQTSTNSCYSLRNPNHAIWISNCDDQTMIRLQWLLINDHPYREQGKSEIPNADDLWFERTIVETFRMNIHSNIMNIRLFYYTIFAICISESSCLSDLGQNNMNDQCWLSGFCCLFARILSDTIPFWKICWSATLKFVIGEKRSSWWCILNRSKTMIVLIKMMNFRLTPEQLQQRYNGPDQSTKNRGVWIQSLHSNITQLSSNVDHDHKSPRRSPPAPSITQTYWCNALTYAHSSTTQTSRLSSQRSSQTCRSLIQKPNQSSSQQYWPIPYRNGLRDRHHPPGIWILGILNLGILNLGILNLGILNLGIVIVRPSHAWQRQSKMPVSRTRARNEKDRRIVVAAKSINLSQLREGI
jgi:hypothetical protein